MTRHRCPAGTTTASLAGVWGVSHDDLARAGAHDLAGFYDGIGASHQGVPAELTAIGHSYGSLTTGLALQEPGNHGVTNAIFLWLTRHRSLNTRTIAPAAWTRFHHGDPR